MRFLNRKTLLVTLINIFVVAVLLEIIIAAALRFPRVASGKFKEFIYNIYIDEYRNIIQYELSCARYDHDLAYTLRPGECTFKNTEFENKFLINSLGVRDDEESLDAPEIIVAGDSLAMGWGVDHDETFAQIVEDRSGYRVLNAAVSSYGTVREMRIISRVNTGRLKYLIVHYSDNDYEENLEFYENNNRLNIMSKITYLHEIKKYKKRKMYYLGKYTLRIADEIFEVIKKHLSPSDANAYENEGGKKRIDEARVFINALMKASNINFENVHIIVIGNDAFIKLLKETMASGDYPGFIENIKLVMDSSLMGRHYYHLDDHITKEGHEAFAEALLMFIR